MKKTLIVVLSLLVSAVACADACNPELGNGCLKFEGQVTAPYQHAKVPAGYFPAPKGNIKVWLTGGSPGTWRVRLLKWSKVRSDEAHNHFHEVASNDIVPGPVQELSYSNLDNFAFFSLHVACEDDCTQKPFEVFVDTTYHP